MKRQQVRLIVFVTAVLAIFLITANGQQAGNAGKKEFTFRGKVEKVDTKAKTLTVNGEKVEGWMDSMSMTYAVDKEDVLSKIMIGDQITAKVYEGDYKILHDVQVVRATK